MSDARVVARCAAWSALILAAAIAVRATPSPHAPRVNVRWADAVEEQDRERFERQLQLRQSVHQGGTTWSYDLADPSAPRVRALLSHPAVADTHHIDRKTGAISLDAPRGTTLVRDDFIARWRDSPVLYWILLLSASMTFVSMAWLTLARSQRQAVNDPR
jgi:hypothetical protein